MNIEVLPAYGYKEEIRELFSEYTKMLVDGDPLFAEYLKIQHYDDEVNDLEYKYGLPDGRLYIVFCDGKAAGCIGLRKIDSENCELKRLYVRQEFRGSGIASMLTKRIISEARETGYKYMLLDTLPFLETAIGMYRRMGFYEIGQYNDSPMLTSIYMKYDL